MDFITAQSLSWLRGLPAQTTKDSFVFLTTPMMRNQPDRLKGTDIKQRTVLHTAGDWWTWSLLHRGYCRHGQSCISFIVFWFSHMCLCFLRYTVASMVDYHIGSVHLFIDIHHSYTVHFCSANTFLLKVTHNSAKSCFWQIWGSVALNTPCFNAASAV